MRLKSFYARTVAEAMRQVRLALGDDAIIVATREEEGGGVRLTAAIEDDDALPPVANAPASGAAHPAARRNAGYYEDEYDVAQVVADTLYAHGTPAAISEKLIEAVEELNIDDPLLALGAALDTVFAFQPLGEEPSGRPLMLVGPPGAGKTLTVAKLAARAMFRNRSIGIITTDTVRAGAVEQLSAFTRLMKLKLLTVEDAAALAGALDVNAGADQIVIDTAGSNPFDGADMDELRDMMAVTPVEPVLVIPAGIDPVEAAEMGSIFRSVGVRRVIVTRLDLTRRFGSMLAAVYESRLNFCDVSISPKVAEGLTPLNPLALARLMMPNHERTVRVTRYTGTHA
ncbi:MAG: GTPase [Rhodospirillaceae bacterium]